MSNILIDIRSLLDKPYTGVAQYTLNYLNDLFERDKENNYFLFYNSYGRNLDLSVICNNSHLKFAKNSHEHIRIIGAHWPNKIFNFLLWFLKWPKIDKLVEKRTGKKIDHIFLPNFNFGVFSRKKKITLVVHDLSFEIYPQFFKAKQRLWHKLVGPINFCQQVSKIITHSENTKNDLVDFYKIDPKKIEVKKPIIAKKFFEAIEEKEKSRVKEKYQITSSFILYLGNLEPRKNLETLIRAFAYCLNNKLLNSYLVLAGTGRELPKLKKLSHVLKVGEQIKFLGYIDEEDKKALYHLAKLFVYPSFYEGYGYPVAEALACGLPVITSQTSSLTEIEGEKITLINPYDLNDLIEAIMRHEKHE